MTSIDWQAREGRTQSLATIPGALAVAIAMVRAVSRLEQAVFGPIFCWLPGTSIFLAARRS